MDSMLADIVPKSSARADNSLKVNVKVRIILISVHGWIQNFLLFLCILGLKRLNSDISVNINR